jgi:hypothetical protein
MKSSFFFTAFLFGLMCQAQEITIFRAPVEQNQTVSYEGNLAQGSLMNDLSWASRSSMACFPGTQNTKFNGHHVFFVTEIPPYSEMFITLIPKNPNANMSIYAYQDGVNSEAFPPTIGSCVSCEADHKWDYPKKGKTQDHTRSVRLNAIRNPYRVVIGIAGADGRDKGAFQVQIELKSR